MEQAFGVISVETSPALDVGQTVVRTHVASAESTLVGMTAAFCDLSLNMPLIAMKTWKQTSAGRTESMWKKAAKNYKKLYTGFNSMYLSYGPNVGIMFALKSAISEQLERGQTLSSHAQRELAASVMAGGISGYIWAAPFEGLMVRRQVAAVGEGGKAAVAPVRSGGLWQGASATAAREMVFASMIFAPRTIQDELFPSHFVAAHPHISHELASCAAGVTGAFVNNPADVVKSRMQASSTPTTVGQVVRDLVRQEGAAWMVRGLGLRALSYSWGTLIISTVTGALTDAIHEARARADERTTA